MLIDVFNATKPEPGYAKDLGSLGLNSVDFVAYDPAYVPVQSHADLGDLNVTGLDTLTVVQAKHWAARATDLRVYADTLAQRVYTVDFDGPLTSRAVDFESEVYHWTESVVDMVATNVPGWELPTAYHPGLANLVYLAQLELQASGFGTVLTVRERHAAWAALLADFLSPEAPVLLLAPDAVGLPPRGRADDELLPCQAPERALPRETRAGPSMRVATSSSEEGEPPRSPVLVAPQ
jgi:hypothetical protein